MGKKARLKPRKKSQKFHLPRRLGQHVSGPFGEPVVERAEEREDGAADEHVMEMGDDEIGVVHLQIEGHRREHDAGEAAEHEDDDEAQGRRAWACRNRGGRQSVASQQKIWMPLGIAIISLAAGEEALPQPRQAVANM